MASILQDNTIRDRPNPPGTVLLEDFGITNGNTEGLIHSRNKTLVLRPQPSCDPNDPLNWSHLRKAINFGLAASYTLFVYTILDISTVAWPRWNIELGISYSNLSNSFATNTAALACGCIILVPLTLKYGRRPVYLSTTLVLACSAVWMALQKTVGDLIGNNLLAGLSGSVGDVVVQLTVADLFFIHQRGTMNAIYTAMVNIGTFAAPVAAGYIIEYQGWPWMFWWCVIFLGATFIGMVFFYEETKYSTFMINSTPASLPVLQDNTITGSTDSDKKFDSSATRSSFEMHEQSLNNDHIDHSIPMKSYRQRYSLVTISPGTFKQFLSELSRPFIYLYTFPAVAFTAIQWGSMLSWFSVIANSQTILFAAPPYNFSSGSLGLLTIPSLIGSLIGAFYGGTISDYLIIYLSKRNGGIYEPEFRLYLCIFPGLVGPAGFYLYGISVTQGLPWIAPLFGTGLFAFSLGAISTIATVYLYDCYIDILGASLVAVSFVRNILATMIVFAFNPWVEGMGYRNTFILCASLSLCLNSLCIPMIIWGKEFRIRSVEKYESYAKDDTFKKTSRM